MTTQSKLDLICVGDELLDGRVRDLNARMLGEWAAERSISLRKIVVIPDSLDTIVAALNDTESETVVVSGGLGPTSDDLTRFAAAHFFGTELQHDQEAEAQLRARFQTFGRTPTENNLVQCLFPAGAKILYSNVGTAAGFFVQKGSQRFYFFPGVPKEFSWFVRSTLDGAQEGESSVNRLFFFGIGESSLAQKIATLDLSKTQLSYRADYPVIEVKLQGASDLVSSAAAAIRHDASKYFVGQDQDVLEARLGRLLLEKGWKVATAESCTAGGLSARITEVSGSSQWFDVGFVTYANQAKSRLLGVSPETLNSKGAVSPEVAIQMAAGALKASGSNIALSVTGIAGPGGGSAEKPVGTVHFALATDKGVWHRHWVFAHRDRTEVRTATQIAAITFALHYLEERLQDYPTSGPFSLNEFTK